MATKITYKELMELGVFKVLHGFNLVLDGHEEHSIKERELIMHIDEDSKYVYINDIGTKLTSDDIIASEVTKFNIREGTLDVIDVYIRPQQ